jgi:hypothetical protein
MKTWQKWCAGLALMAGVSPAARAQVPVAAPAPAFIPGAPVPSAAGAAPVAGAGNMWGFLCMTPEQKLQCKMCFCNSAIGRIFNASMAPVAALSGGLFGTCCPLINPAALLLPPDSAAGAAARVMADEADAKARRAAVCYLGTVDCNYWPEAQDALIVSLRADRNPCVRLQAALVLNRGCCCTLPIIEALVLTVSGSDADGNPREDCERVKAAAYTALEHCLSCYAQIVEVKPPVGPNGPRTNADPDPNSPGVAKGGPRGAERMTPTEYYKRSRQKDISEVVLTARKAMEQVRLAPQAHALAPTADHSVVGIIQSAYSVPAAPPHEQIISQKLISERVVEGPAMPGETRTTVQTVTPPLAPPAPVKAATFSDQGRPQAPAVKQAQKAVEQPQAPPRSVQAAPAQPQARSAQTAAPAAQAPQGAMGPEQVVAMLQAGQSPQQREWAANALAGVDGWNSPKVVQALVAAARADADPTVRAACLHTLGRMNVRTLPVVACAQALKSDSDPRVRAEAEQTLRLLGS